MFIYISKIVPGDSQANESNFEKIDLWWTLHANRTTETSAETSVAKLTCVGNSKALTLTQRKI